MSDRRYRKARQKRDPGGFVALPHIVLSSMEFAALSPKGVKLLLDLLAQYRGNNNGDLTLTWSVMVKRGWKSRDTLERARRELLDGRWIELTAQGGLHRPSLYGVTLFALDPSPKLEVTAQGFSRGAWKQRTPMAIVTKSTSANTPVVSVGTGIDPPVVANTNDVLPIDTPIGRVIVL